MWKALGAGVERVARNSQTPYFIFHTKSSLLKQVVSFASSRVDENVPVIERPPVREIDAPTDGQRP